MIELIVFLGNPGKEYQKTRHNLGFMAALELEQQLGPWNWSKKGEARFCTANITGRKITLCCPENFMNNSGKAVRTLLDFFKFKPSQMLVLYDDLETNYGVLKVKIAGGAGGHKGIRSIDQHCPDPNYFRLRIGIGRPVHGDISNWVLSRFSKDEEILLPLVLAKALETLKLLVSMDNPSLENSPKTLGDLKAFQGA